jgi:hypothetical protein
MASLLLVVAALLLPLAAADPNPRYWRSKAGLKKLCSETGYGCAPPNAT